MKIILHGKGGASKDYTCAGKYKTENSIPEYHGPRWVIEFNVEKLPTDKVRNTWESCRFLIDHDYAG